MDMTEAIKITILEKIKDIQSKLTLKILFKSIQYNKGKDK
jgi:hypothetical protein